MSIVKSDRHYSRKSGKSPSPLADWEKQAKEEQTAIYAMSEFIRKRTGIPLTIPYKVGTIATQTQRQKILSMYEHVCDWLEGFQNVADFDVRCGVSDSRHCVR